MMGASRARIATFAGLAVGAAVLFVAVPPDARIALARVAVVGAGIIVAAVYLRRSRVTTASTPERFELELRRAPEVQPTVASLRAVEMTVRLSTASAHDFDVRLRPLLRDLARWRLLANRGVDMDAKPEVARRLLGEPLASFVDGSAEPPSFGAPGVPLADIDAGIDQLERI